MSAELGVEENKVKVTQGIWQTSWPQGHDFCPGSNLIVPCCSSLGLSWLLKLKRKTPPHATPLSPVWEWRLFKVVGSSKKRSRDKAVLVKHSMFYLKIRLSHSDAKSSAEEGLTEMMISLFFVYCFFYFFLLQLRAGSCPSTPERCLKLFG